MTKGPGFLDSKLHFTKRETEAREGATRPQRPSDLGTVRGRRSSLKRPGRNPSCRVLMPGLLLHTLQRKTFYEGIYFSQNTPPVNKIPQSPTF